MKLEPAGPRRYKANVSWKREGENPDRVGWVTLLVAGESVRVPVRVRDKPLPKAPPGQAPDPAAASPGANPPTATPPAPDAPTNGEPRTKKD